MNNVPTQFSIPHRNLFNDQEGRILDQEISPSQQRMIEKYTSFAESMETEFINLMLEEMNKSIGKSESEGAEESYFQGMLQKERSSIMSKTQGMGIKEMILAQILPEELRGRRDSLIKKIKNYSFLKNIQNKNELPTSEVFNE